MSNLLFLENIIFLVFPILIYFLLLSLNEVSDKKRDLMLKLAIYTELYLLFVLNGSVLNEFPLCFYSIPSLIALDKRFYKTYCFSNLLVSLELLISGFNPCAIIINLLLILGLFKMFEKVKNNYCLFVYVAIQAIFYLYFYALNGNTPWYTCIFMSLFLLSISLITISIIHYADNVINYRHAQVALEKERDIEKSLFKVTHEIKNPLAVCNGYLEILGTNDKLDNYKKYVPIIKEEIEHTLLIIQDFSNLTKIAIEKKLLDINVLITDVTGAISSLLKEKNITLLYDSNDKEIYINGDYKRLKQVFFNIIKNCVEAIPDDNGVIEIDVKEIDDRILIYVKDNGVGMSLETIKKIKEPFYTTKKRGTGLGIYLSNEIIELHKGNIRYESVIGSGTTCIIMLPVYDIKKDIQQ